jgi:NADH-quinone oxidoreductase subunit H
MNLLNIILLFIGWSVFLVVAGLFVLGIERKIAARLQWRVGPPIWQNFTDVIKLSGKEILIPEKANKLVFIIAPFAAFLSALVSGVIIILSLLYGKIMPGDLILLIYLLTVPSLCLFLGASASGNILASVGASREIKLVLAYELPFIAAMILVIFKSGFSTSLYNIIKIQKETGINFLSVAGFLGFFIAFLGIIGKLGIVPFDIAEAETEIAGGVLVEYSGMLLGFYKMTRAILFIVLPVLLMVCFLGGFNGWVGLLKYIVIFVLLVLIKNTNPRVRIDQALRFYWGFTTIIIFISFLFLRV